MQRIVTHYRGFSTGMSRLGFSLDDAEQFVAAYSSDNTLRVWNVRGGEAVAKMSAQHEAGERPLWTTHWGDTALLGGEGELSLWHQT